MAPSPPALPTNRALLVQVRAQPPETPMAWEGRVEHVVSGQGTHVQTLAALLAFMRRVLTDEQAQAAAPCAQRQAGAGPRGEARYPSAGPPCPLRWPAAGRPSRRAPRARPPSPVWAELAGFLSSLHTQGPRPAEGGETL